MQNRIQFVISFIIASFFATSARAEEFDLRRPSQTATVTWWGKETPPPIVPATARVAAEASTSTTVPAPSTAVPTPRVYSVALKNTERIRKFVVAGPFIPLEGSIQFSNDNLPRNPIAQSGVDQGRTFGVQLNGVYTDGDSKKIEITFASNLFTQAPTSSVRQNGRSHVTVNSTEQELVSARLIKMKDGYYVFAGAGAELLTTNGTIARQMQQSYHELQTKTKKTYSYMQEGRGLNRFSPQAHIGIGKEFTTEVGGVEMFLVPEVAAQVSTVTDNIQLQTRAKAGARLGGTTVSAYGSYDLSPGRDANSYGLRVERDVSFRRGGNRTSVYFAVERIEDAFDRIYGNENKRNKNMYYRMGVRKTFGAR